MAKTYKIIVILALYTLPCIPQAHAILGAGDIVFDPQSFQQQLTNYAMQIKQYSTQIQQLQSLNYQANLSDLTQMQNTLNSAIGISNDYGRMQGQFQRLYPDFSTYKGQAGASYAQQSFAWSQNNQQNALDLLTVTTKLQQSMLQDQNSLNYLNNRSDTAAGTKDLLQTANQLLILITKQLMQLQQLISTSAKADASYLAEKASNDEASRAQSSNFYRDMTKHKPHTPAPAPGSW